MLNKDLGGGFESSQEDCEHIMKKLPKSDIILSHYPPMGINSSGNSPHEGFF